jgi:hypothetical protein
MVLGDEIGGKHIHLMRYIPLQHSAVGRELVHLRRDFLMWNQIQDSFLLVYVVLYPSIN